MIDLNCDMGEGFGAWKMGNDAALMDHVSSVNIACGFHAGDATIMRKTAALAIQKNIKIGAHPGYPDLTGFGRRAMQLSTQEVYDICVYQIGALKATVEALGGKLHHIKPHGALYNTASQNKELAQAIAEATKAVDERLVLYGLANSFLISEADKIGLKTAAEGFVDRTYQSDGSLTPRTQPNALLTTVQESLKQVEQFIESKSVTCVSGEVIPLRVDTICIHGDGEHAVEFAKAIWEMFVVKRKK